MRMFSVFVNSMMKLVKCSVLTSMYSMFAPTLLTHYKGTCRSAWIALLCSPPSRRLSGPIFRFSGGGSEWGKLIARKERLRCREIYRTEFWVCFGWICDWGWEVARFGTRPDTVSHPICWWQSTFLSSLFHAMPLPGSLSVSSRSFSRVLRRAPCRSCGWARRCLRFRCTAWCCEGWATSTQSSFSIFTRGLQFRTRRWGPTLRGRSSIFGLESIAPWRCPVLRSPTDWGWVFPWIWTCAIAFRRCILFFGCPLRGSWRKWPSALMFFRHLSTPWVAFSSSDY